MLELIALLVPVTACGASPEDTNPSEAAAATHSLVLVEAPIDPAPRTEWASLEFNVPAGRAPAEFPVAMREVLDECELTPRADSFRIECDEAPCLAVLVDSGVAWKELTGCESWRSHFGRGATLSFGPLACPHGAVDFLAATPTWPEFTGGAEDVDGPRQTRLRERFEALHRRACAEGEG